MRTLLLNVEDGKGLISIAVSNDIEAARIQGFMRDAREAIAITYISPTVNSNRSNSNGIA